ncbi:Gfo/Idh/MocA family oxidoreductase [Paenibacillus sp. CC-CFT747]|nr:Gfo/Idh/MocA family oxidoreductase [Paenibacillus sp. CC-CFT747]
MTLRIGFIGVGGIAQHHMLQLKEIPEAQVVLVYDVNREATEQTAAGLGARAAGSADEVLDKSQVDAVYVCVPPFAREELEVTAARRGIPFFVEKPLGVDLELVRRKAAVIRESGVLHAVGYVLRYYDTVQRAKNYLQNKPYHLVQASRLGGSHPSKWWKQLDLSGGNLVDAATHQVDLLRYAAGEFKEVFASFGQTAIRQLDPDATIYDSGALSFTMQSGAVGSLTESCMSTIHPGNEVRVYGSDFFLELSGNGRTLLIKDAGGEQTWTSEKNAFLEQARAFLQAVSTGSREPILCDYDDGLKTLEFTLAANRSGLERRVVELA